MLIFFELQLVEARTAILLLKNRAIATRTEPTMWILENMFRPLASRDHNVSHCYENKSITVKA
jgi:hypothetical protein